MKTAKFFAVFIAAMLFAACNDGGDEDPKDDWHGDFGTIQVPDTRQLDQTVESGSTEGSQGVTFSTEGAWTSAIAETTRAAAPDWVSITPDHGDAAGDYTIRITLEPNPINEDRTATITITSNGSTIKIVITQKYNNGGTPAPEEQKGRLAQITQYENGKYDSTWDFTYDDHERLASVTVKDNEGPIEKHIFTYTNDKATMHYEETYYDKGTYTGIWDCEGEFPGGTGGRIDKGIHHDQSTQSDTDEEIYTFTYGIGGFLDNIAYSYPDGTPIFDRYSYDRESSHNSCTRIAWEATGTQWGGQQFTYDYSDNATSRSSREFKRLFSATQSYNPGLLLIEEPDLLSALGFYGTPSYYMPVEVTTKVSGSSASTYKQRISYEYTIPKDWKAGERIDGMTITFDNSYDGTDTPQKLVLSFEGI